MSQNVLSRQSDCRGSASRQRRWRARQRVRRQTEERLRQRLGRDPSPAEMHAELEAQLAALGLRPRPPRFDDDRDGDTPSGAAEDPGDAVPPDGEDSGATIPERASYAGAAGRVAALGSIAFETQLAAARDRVFALLMAAAERGDISALLFMAGRLAPPARPRRVVAVPE